MNPNAQFERDLEQWLQAEASASAPAGFHAAVMARARTMRQRPGWTTSLPARWFGRRRPLTLLAAAALLLVGGAMAAGSGLVRLPSVVPPAPAPSPAAVASPSPDEASPSPAISPSPAPTGPAVAVRPGQFNIGDHRLVSDSVGWVSTPDALYRTEDLGRTWSAVTPPGWSIGRGSRDLFVDADTAYSFLPGSGTIAVTHDGGATWVETLLDGTTGGDPNLFQTPQGGSLVFVGLQKFDPSTVFDTTDGGLTWTGPRRGPSEDSRWPFEDAQGMPGVVVRTFIPGGPDLPPKSVLQISHDAGATWVNRPYPAIPEAFTTSVTLTPATVVAAWGDDSGRIVLAIASIYLDGGGPNTLLYTSLDDGRSWQYVTSPATLPISPDSRFLSASEWVLVSADGLSFTSTVDGGAHWRTTTRSSPFVGGG